MAILSSFKIPDKVISFYLFVKNVFLPRYQNLFIFSRALEHILSSYLRGIQIRRNGKLSITGISLPSDVLQLLQYVAFSKWMLPSFLVRTPVTLLFWIVIFFYFQLDGSMIASTCFICEGLVRESSKSGLLFTVISLHNTQMLSSVKEWLKLFFTKKTLFQDLFYRETEM